jgi:hypothetical protein
MRADLHGLLSSVDIRDIRVLMKAGGTGDVLIVPFQEL